MNQATHPMEREEVMAYLDGEMDAARAAAVETHLSECAECRALADDLRGVSQKMAAWQVEGAPTRLSENVEAAAKGEEKQKVLTLTPLRRIHWVWKIAGGFALLLIVAAISIPNLLRSRMEWTADTGEYVATEEIRVPMPEASTSSAGSVKQPDKEQIGKPMIIRTAALTIVTKEFENTRAAMEQMVRKHGGYIAQLSTSGRPGSAHSLSATVRIPADKLDTALAELKSLGRIEGETVSGEEVTQQYVDLVARLANARHTELRLVQVLQQRTGKVADVLEVEREIARVREEIERMDAQRKNLEKQVQFATVSLRITEEYKAQVGVPEASIGTQMWNAAVDGYRTLTETALGLALFLLRQGPVLLFWVALLWWPARFVWRRVRASA